MVRPRPAIRQKFGFLTVLEKSSNGRWLLRCDCGNTVNIPRGDFDRVKGSPQTSCGCRRKLGLVDNNRRPKNISGQKFGELTAVKLTGKKDKGGKPTWLLKCDCGDSCEMSLSRIGGYVQEGIRLNCGSSTHPRYCRYPPAPIPYPEEAGELLKKYLKFTELHYQRINGEAEDEKRDRLIRAAWIITYRRSRGEFFCELREKNFILKHLRYSSIDVFRRHQLEQHGGLMHTSDGKIRKIHTVKPMTETSINYPVIETLGINALSKVENTRRIRFRRC